MEVLLSQYLWQFVLVYIDDILIFSRSLEEHLTHLSVVLTLLESAGITLSISKCFFAYDSIQALGHQVSCLGLSTVQEKVEVVRNLVFPTTLKQLEHALGFFGYYHKFVKDYASVVEPLVKVKKKGFRQAPIKGLLETNTQLVHSSTSMLNPRRGYSGTRI
jgi:hypothetical protein